MNIFRKFVKGNAAPTAQSICEEALRITKELQQQTHYKYKELDPDGIPFTLVDTEKNRHVGYYIEESKGVPANALVIHRKLGQASGEMSTEVIKELNKTLAETAAWKDFEEHPFTKTITKALGFRIEPIKGDNQNYEIMFCVTAHTSLKDAYGNANVYLEQVVQSLTKKLIELSKSSAAELT